VKKLSPVKLLLGVIGLAIGIIGVLALREATLSTHEAVEGSGMELVVDADSKGGEQGQSLKEMVEAQLLACRLEVSSDVVDPLESLGGGQFRTVLEPALDETNKKQFRGCVEDWIIDHLRVSVVELNGIP
jgi:hypothetical protein